MELASQPGLSSSAAQGVMGSDATADSRLGSDMAPALIVMPNVTSDLSSGRILVMAQPFLQSRDGPGESAGVVAIMG
jgi:hypothetical protein